MTEAARLSIAIEATGIDQAASEMAKLEAAGKKAAASVQTSMSGVERDMAGLQAMFDRATSGIVGSVDRLNANMVRGLSGIEKAMSQMQARTQAATASATKSLDAANASVSKATEAVTRNANAVSESVATIATASSAAAAGLDHVGGGVARMGAQAGAANQNVKLTAEQVRNLGYQINDVGTMLAMGASPFQVITSQAGQVIQALGDGPGGVKGSLQAIQQSIISFGARLGPVGLAVGALGAAGAVALAMWPNVQDRIERVNRAAERFAGTLQDIRRGNADLADLIEKNVGRSLLGDSSTQQARILAEVANQRAALEQARKGVGQATFLGLGVNPFSIGKDAFQTLTGGVDIRTIQEMAAGFVEGTKSAEALRKEIYELQAAGEVPDYLKGAIDQVLELTEASIAGAARVKELQEGLQRLRTQEAQKRYDDASSTLTGLLPSVPEIEKIERAYQATLGRISQLRGSDKSIDRDGLRETARRQRDEAIAELSRPARESLKAVQDSLNNLDLSPLNRQIAETTQEYDRRIEEYKRTTNDAAGLADLQREKEVALQIITKEAADAEAERRAGYELDLQSVNDRTDAQRANTAAQRAYIDALADNLGETTALARAEEARALSLAQSSARMQESVQQQEDQIRLLQAEIGMIGMSDDARRVALAGLQAEIDLKRQGVDLNSQWGQTYVQNAQQIATLDVALDKQQDAFDDLKDAASGFFQALSSGSGIMDALASTFGRFASQLASKGLDQLFGGLLGKGAANAPSVVGAITQAVAQIPVYGSGMGIDQTYAAPLGAVTRAPLPPVVTGEGFSSSKASTVARQSVPAQMWNFFASKGLASHQIAGILGNARAESAFNPNARGDGGAALGLFQWNDRANAMKAFVGSNWQSNVQGQLDFAWKELQTSESKAYRALLQATNVTQATEAFLGFERPHGYNTGVRNSHNYSGRVGYAQEAFSQFEGRSPTPVVEARTLRKGVAEGVVDANQKLGGDNWGGLRTVSPGAPPAAAQSGGLFGARGQAGFSVLGAGLGAFSNGYQSGSPLSGGLGGAFSGYGAGGAISSFLGIGAGAGAALGVVGGAALGIIGGILGAREKRKQAHQQAAEQWAQVRPQYEAFDASLSGDRGDFRTYITDAWNQLSGFMDVGGKAWKMGKGNSTAQFNSTGTKLFEGFLKMLSEFQEGFDSMVSDMASGQGLQGAFAKGRAATKDLASQLKKTRDDIDIAFGNIASIDFLNTPAAQQQAQETERQRADAIARYNDAAAKYALSLLYTAEKVSDVQQTIDGLRGTAAGLVPIFKDLGWNADEAARVIDERLNAAIANIARGLEQNLADRIDDLSGRSYLTSVRSFLEEYEGLQRDFSAAGADASRLPEFFKLQAQSIVDGAELTGDAFAELVRLFPQLNGVVVEAGQALGASTAEIADAIRGYEDRLADVRSAGNELVAFERRAAKERTDAAKFGADALASLEKTLAAERAAIVLSQAKAALEQSYQAETDRINELLNARRDEASELESAVDRLKDFRDQVKEFRDSLKLDDNLSTLNAKDRVDEAGRQFRELLAKARDGDEDAQSRLTGAAQEYLNEAKGYYQTSTDYGDIFEEVNRALADTQATTESALSVSQSQLDALKRQITLDEQQLETNRKQYEAILGLNEGIKSLEVAFREYAAAAAAARAAGITVPGTGGASSGGANYDAPRRPGLDVSTESAKYLANNADVAAAIAAGQTFGLPAGMAPEVYASAHFGLHGQTEGRKWATGGLITGPGTGTSDSIPMWASNGEFMMREAAVSSVGAGTMDYINRTGRLPTIAMPASPRMVGSGNDNRGIEQRLDAMQRTLIALTTTTGGGLQRVAEAGEAGARATEQRALAERRSANNKQAA